MEIEKKDYAEAIKYLKKAQSIKIKSISLNQKISWSIGWNLFLQKKFKESSSFFKKEKKKHKDYFFNLKLNFWESISLDKLGHKKKAENLWGEMYKNNPFSYYGIISQLKLNKPFHPFTKSQNESNTLNKNQSKTLDFLLAIKELKLAKNFLKESSKKIKDIKELKNLVPFYNKLKWHRGLINKFYSIKANKRVPHTKYFFHHLFPMPFQDFVNKASKKFNIERELIYSITRQESAFDLFSRSYAEAYGPMQITPENASFLSKKFKISYKSPHDLFTPQVNFDLGSALLKGLQERFNHQFIFYVAAYNASHRSVERWAKERYNGDPLQFIELIPYNETKNYVKLVLRNYINYKRLNSKKPFYFPKDIL
jgi:soluble lytic murein transglycosylase